MLNNWKQPTKKKPRKPMNRAGKKVKQWQHDRPLLLLELDSMGITSCEIRLPGCWRRHDGCAHVDKRDSITPEELRYAAVSSCNPCHDILDERMLHAEMRQIIERIIKDRPTGGVLQYRNDPDQEFAAMIHKAIQKALDRGKSK